MTSERRAYFLERSAVGSAPPNCFSNVIARHASRMVDMVRHTSKRELVGAWADLSRVNDEWVSLLSTEVDPDTPFNRVCAQLVHGYVVW